MFAAHCSRRGAAPCAPMGAKIGSLDAPENCPHFAATRARVRALRAARPRMARPCRGVGVAIALQPTWRGPPRADCGENGRFGCAGKLPAFRRPARPRKIGMSYAHSYFFLDFFKKKSKNNLRKGNIGVASCFSAGAAKVAWAGSAGVSRGVASSFSAGAAKARSVLAVLGACSCRRRPVYFCTILLEYRAKTNSLFLSTQNAVSSSHTPSS